MAENVKQRRQSRNGIIPADKHLLELIPLYNKVQDCYNAIGQTFSLDLPQIVVIGSQSSGKSSVVESLIGRDILPRGTGIVTRCPVTLHLYHISPDNGPERYEFVYSDKRPTLTLTDPTKVRPEIEKETNLLAAGKNISQIPIVLNIYSPDVLTFSLVDLPGLFKNIQLGQNETAAQDVDALVRKYVSNPNAIILVVWPADNELATSEALQLAKEYDPQGQRTMVVLTKLDIMNPGTDAKEMLDGHTKLANKLQLGIYGVVGRSQDDIKNNVSVHEAKRKEEDFLRSNYPEHMKKGQVGSTAVGYRLQQLLLEKIHQAQMFIEQQVNAEMEKAQKALEHFGIPVEEENYVIYLMKVIHCFEEIFRNRLNGNDDVAIDKLEGGAKIHVEFFDHLPKALHTIDVAKKFTHQELEVALANFQAVGISVFGSSQVMARFLKPAIDEFLSPSEIVLGQVSDILREIVVYAAEETMKKYARFGRFVTAVQLNTITFIEKRYHETKKALASYIEQEKSLLNFYHPLCQPLYEHINALEISKPAATAASGNVNNFNGVESQTQNKVKKPSFFKRTNKKKIKTDLITNPSLNGDDESLDSDSILQDDYNNESGLPRSLLPKALSDYVVSNPLNNVEDTVAVTHYKINDVQHAAQMITAYFEIVRINVQDTVPKLIRYQFLDYTAKNVFDELTEKFKNANDWEQLLQETDEIIAQREQTENKLEKMKVAVTAMRDIKELQARHAVPNY